VQVYENAQCKEKPRYKAILENGQVYPIFVIWRSGAFTTYGDHLARQREGRASSTAPLTSPLYFLTDVLASVVNAPKAWTVTGRHSLRATINRSETDKRLLDVPREESSFFYTGEGTDVAGTKLRTAKWILTSPAKVGT
jgi:hypothetical protein